MRDLGCGGRVASDDVGDNVLITCRPRSSCKVQRLHQKGAVFLLAALGLLPFWSTFAPPSACTCFSLLHLKHRRVFNDALESNILVFHSSHNQPTPTAFRTLPVLVLSLATPGPFPAPNIAMAADIPTTMKAWQVVKNGEPNQALSLDSDHPVPSKLRSGNILIKVDYSALNPADLHFMANIPNWVPFRRNPIPGLDFAGQVVKLGTAVPRGLGLEIGTEVCGALNVMSVMVGRGSLAEYIEVPASKVVVKPKGIAAKDAAGALGIAGQTALIVLKEVGVKPGDRVLVNGASGGVGSVLVQVAKAKGAVVYAICSGANAELVKSLGADEVGYLDLCVSTSQVLTTRAQVIDYKAHESVTSHLASTCKSNPLRAVFDCVGNDELFQKSTNYLDKNGIFITIVGGVGAGPIVRSKVLPVMLGGVPRRYKLLALWPDGAIAKEVAKWVEEGHFKHFLVDSEYSMEDAVKVSTVIITLQPLLQTASPHPPSRMVNSYLHCRLQGYERVASKRSKGKVIISVSS